MTDPRADAAPEGEQDGATAETSAPDGAVSAVDGAAGKVTPPPPHRSPWQRFRWVAVIVLFVALYAVGKWTGLVDDLEPEEVRRTVSEAGPWGVLLFVVIFSAGELIHIPGMLFVAAGILAWGRLGGFFVSLLGAVVSVSVSFWVVRGLGGRALTSIDKPFMRKMLGRLHARPIVTIVILRALFWVSPPLNYALALTNVKFREYLIGSAIGLVFPVALAALVFEWLFQ